MVKKKKKEPMYKYIYYITPVLVATEECLLGISPGSTRCKALGRWHLSARVSRVWHSSHRKARKNTETGKRLFLISTWKTKKTR